MAPVLRKKSTPLVPPSAEDADLINKSSKKVKIGGSSGGVSDWPKIGNGGSKPWKSGQSFAHKLQGINEAGVEGEASHEKDALSDNAISLSDSEIDDGHPLCTIKEDPGRNFPTFSFSEKMKKKLYKAWNNAVIVKLLGKNIGYKLLLSILQSLWAKKGVISLINIGNGFFVVKLSNKDDYLNALTGGPWMVFDHYLTVRPWEPLFQPSCATIDKVAVWVRMPKIALEYYDKDALTWIGDRIGEIIKVDFNTSCQLRGRYARICVLVDLGKQLMSGFSLDGKDFYVEYEGLHDLCVGCGVYGHKSEACKSGVVPSSSEMIVEGNGVVVGKVGTTVLDGKKDDTDIWRVVSRPRRQKKGTLEKQPGQSNGMVKGSRFDVLAVEEKSQNVTVVAEKAVEEVSACAEVTLEGMHDVGTEVVEVLSSIEPNRKTRGKKGGKQGKLLEKSGASGENSIVKTISKNKKKEGKSGDLVLMEEERKEMGREKYLIKNVPGNNSENGLTLEEPKMDQVDDINWTVNSQSNIPLVPGEPVLAAESMGRFWADSAQGDPDCSMVVETPDELKGTSDGLEAQVD